jgi:CheY-specific phosphatase CheX
LKNGKTRELFEKNVKVCYTGTIMVHSEIFPEALVRAVNEAVGSVYDPPVPAPNDESVYGLDGIVSAIYLKGDIFGKISLFIRRSSAAKVVANMLGVDELAENSSEVMDGVGEVLNILTGCFKKQIAAHQVHLEISVPSTREVALMPVGRWENNIEQVFTARDVAFKVCLSYRVVVKEEKPAQPSVQAKVKLSAAELLKQAMAKKK